MDYEELLGMFITIAQELDKDKKSAEKIKDITNKILQSKDPNQLNMLESAVLSLFDKAKAEFPKKNSKYISNRASMMFDDLWMRRNSYDDNASFAITYPYDGQNENTNAILECGINNAGWSYLHAYVTLKVNNNQFDKKAFVNSILNLRIQEENLTILNKQILEKYFPIDEKEEESEESVNKRQIEMDSLILRYQGWHDNLKDCFAGGAPCCWQIRNSYLHVIGQELTHLHIKKIYFCGTNALKPYEFAKFIAKAKNKYSELEARYTRNQFSNDHKYDEAMLKYHIFPLEITEDMKKEQKNGSK